MCSQCVSTVVRLMPSFFAMRPTPCSAAIKANTVAVTPVAEAARAAVLAEDELAVLLYWVALGPRCYCGCDCYCWR
jgi:hypothetical protein